jgi:hypothetical protein
LKKISADFSAFVALSAVLSAMLWTTALDAPLFFLEKHLSFVLKLAEVFRRTSQTQKTQSCRLQQLASTAR